MIGNPPARRVLSIVREQPGQLSRERVIGKLIARGESRSAARSELEEELARGGVFERVVYGVGPRGKASTRRVLELAPSRTVGSGATVRPELALPDDWLARLWRRSGLSLSELERRLRARGVPASKQSLSKYARGERRIPGAHEDTIRDTLVAASRERLVTLRESRALTQAEAGTLIGRSDKVISERETHPWTGPDGQWSALIEELARQPRAAQEDPGPELTVEELEALLTDSLIGAKQLARELDVTYATVWQWRRRRRPIPAKYWRRVREILATASPPPHRDRIRDDVLPALLELASKAATPLLVSRARRDLKRGLESVRAAFALAEDLGLAHAEPVEVVRANGAPHQYVGLVLGPRTNGRAAPTPTRTSNASRDHRALEILSGRPGLSAKRLRRPLKTGPKDTRETVARLVEAGAIYQEDHVAFTDGRGRRRTRTGYFLTARGRAALDERFP